MADKEAASVQENSEEQRQDASNAIEMEESKELEPKRIEEEEEEDEEQFHEEDDKPSTAALTGTNGLASSVTKPMHGIICFHF